MFIVQFSARVQFSASFSVVESLLIHDLLFLPISTIESGVS